MLPTKIQKTDLKNWTFTSSDHFQVTPTTQSPEQNTKEKKNPPLTSQGCRCTNITAQHFMLPISQPCPPLGSHFVSYLKSFFRMEHVLIMNS